MDEFKNENTNNEETEDIKEEIKYAKAFVVSEEKKKICGAPSWLKEVYEWTQSIAFAVILALLINQFLFSIVQVEGHSMDPTLDHKQRLVVSKLFYKPEAKDIVIVKSSALNKYIVKRIIALPGQVIDLNAKTGDVTIDGNVIYEPYIKEKLRSVGSSYDYPFTVPEDTVFVMGDNRNNSQDSRSIGVVPFDELVGKAVLRILPISDFGGLYGNLE